MGDGCRQMHDGIIDITKLENTSHHFAVYEILTSQLNHIGDHVIVYKVINEYGRSYLTDDGYTWNELKMYGLEWDDMVWPLRSLLHDYPFVYMEGDEFCTSLEDVDFDCRLKGLLVFIEAVYKEFLE